MKKVKSSEITPERIYKNRRKFVQNLGLAAGSMFIGQNFINLAQASSNSIEQEITELHIKKVSVVLKVVAPKDTDVSNLIGSSLVKTKLEVVPKSKKPSVKVLNPAVDIFRKLF